jgi:hypothetical protein
MDEINELNRKKRGDEALKGIESKKNYWPCKKGKTSGDGAKLG